MFVTECCRSFSPEFIASKGVAWRVRRTSLPHRHMCVRKSGIFSRRINCPSVKGCEKESSLLFLSVFPSLFQQTAEHAALLKRKSTPWSKNDLGSRGVASLMAVCKSRAFMAFPSTHSQQPSTGCHSSHYTLHPQQETQPDRPIGYGAFGVVWWVFRGSNI